MSDNRHIFENNCPINEQTGDGKVVGRCWYYLRMDCCPRHGDVSKAKQRYKETGELTLEKDHYAEQPLSGRPVSHQP